MIPSELQIFLGLIRCVYKQNHAYKSFKVFSAPEKVLLVKMHPELVLYTSYKSIVCFTMALVFILASILALDLHSDVWFSRSPCIGIYVA